MYIMIYVYVMKGKEMEMRRKGGREAERSAGDSNDILYYNII